MLSKPWTPTNRTCVRASPIRLISPACRRFPYLAVSQRTTYQSGCRLWHRPLKKALYSALLTPTSGQPRGIVADQSFRSAEIEWLLLLSVFEDLKIHLRQCWLHGSCGRHFSLDCRIESLASFISQRENFLLVELF